MASTSKLNAQIAMQVEHAFRVLFATLEQEHNVETAYMSPVEQTGIRVLKGELTMWLTKYIAFNQKRTSEFGNNIDQGGYFAAMVYTPPGPAKRKN